jgi:hypothetical protein
MNQNKLSQIDEILMANLEDNINQKIKAIKK